MKKLALIISGLTFTAIAFATMLAPAAVARAYGFTIAPTDVDGMNRWMSASEAEVHRELERSERFL